MDRLQPQDTLQLILKVVSRDTLLQICLTSSLNHNLSKLRLCLEFSKPLTGRGLVNPSAT
jgi:hypothetical protein